MKYEQLTIKHSKQGLTITQKFSNTVGVLVTALERYKNNIPIALSEDVLFSSINLEDKSISVVVEYKEKSSRKEKETFLNYLFTTYVIPQLKADVKYIKCKSNNGLIFYISETEERLLNPYELEDEAIINKEYISEILETQVSFEDAVRDLLKQVIKTNKGE